MLLNPQLKGKEHIEYIRRMALSIWKQTGYTEGQFPASLLIACKRHRDEQYALIKKQSPKYPNCICCKMEMEESEVFNFACFCYDCWKGKRVNTAAIHNN